MVAAQVSRPPGEPWWKLIIPREMLGLSLSPDGTRLAGLGHNGYGSTVILVDVETLKAKDLVKPRRISLAWRYTRSAMRVSWIADDLLAVDFNDNESEAIDLSGQKVAELGEHYMGLLPGKGDSAARVLAMTSAKTGAVAQFNARTGEKAPLRVGLPGKVVDWAFDPSGTLRAVTTMDTAFWSDRTKVSIWYRADAQADWQLLEETPVTEDHMSLLFVPDEPDSLVVMARQDRDTQAVYRYDTRQRKIVELMAAHPTEDIVDVGRYDHDGFRRVTTKGLRPQTFWFDPRWAGLQAAIDKAIPGQRNILSGNPRGRVLVYSYADTDPGRWFLFDTSQRTLKQIAQSAPLVDPESMRPMSTLQYPAADGFTIPAYLTLPAGAKGPVPTIVMIHGGPQARDDWGWDQEVQILAMNGYAVFQPQFRGSTGFGKKFQEAGYGQWGRAMQDDITSGVRHLIDQKIADPERICIVGASYGGYAALWGVIKTPDLYKCGVSFAGVTDITEMLDDWSDRNSNPVVRELQSRLIGSKSAKEQFDEVSPLKHADRVKVPLLIAHGEEDRRVPISHSERMVKALKYAGKDYEWLPFPEEGHGLTYVADSKLYFTTLLKFLDRHIGASARRQGSAAASTEAAPGR